MLQALTKVCGSVFRRRESREAVSPRSRTRVLPPARRAQPGARAPPDRGRGRSAFAPGRGRKTKAGPGRAMKLMANIVFFHISFLTPIVEGPPSSAPRSFVPIAGRHAPRAWSVGCYERWHACSGLVCVPKRLSQGNTYPAHRKYFPTALWSAGGPGRQKKRAAAAAPRLPAAAAAPASAPGPLLDPPDFAASRDGAVSQRILF